MARTSSRRGIGFLVILAVLVYALVSGGIALTTGRDCNNKGLVRASWNFVPPRWECETGTNVPLN